MKQFDHKPVLKEEVVEYLAVKPGEKYIDATLGGGGHTEAIIQKGGLVLGIDQDKEAIEFVKKNLELRIENLELKIAYGNFRDIKELAKENGFEHAAGVLFDLGVSSYQLDTPERGFSIKHNAPLDMRMDANSTVSAQDIVNSYSVAQLTDIFERFGEEEKAEQIAHTIVEERKKKRIETTGDLVAILGLNLNRQSALHPATKIFQALRIETNQELHALRMGLAGAYEICGAQARIVVISFHSLEDRITKRIFSDWEEKGLGNTLTKKPITVNIDEVRSNPRARSAKMRVFEKGKN